MMILDLPLPIAASALICISAALTPFILSKQSLSVNYFCECSRCFKILKKQMFEDYKSSKDLLELLIKEKVRNLKVDNTVSSIIVFLQEKSLLQAILWESKVALDLKL